jgi:hypothetical protein
MPQESAAIQPLAAETDLLVPEVTPEAPETSQARLPHTCRCGTRWSGTRIAHCGACHETFSGVAPFDAHRRGGVCRPPAEIGLTLFPDRAYRCWGNPADGIGEATAAMRLASGEICQLGQPAPCGDYHSAGQCVRPRDDAEKIDG